MPGLETLAVATGQLLQLRLQRVDAFAAHVLDRAAAENAVGGPFYPGIDVSWLIRARELYAEPFRFRTQREPAGERPRAYFQHETARLSNAEVEKPRIGAFATTVDNTDGSAAAARQFLVVTDPAPRGGPDRRFPG